MKAETLTNAAGPKSWKQGDIVDISKAEFDRLSQQDENGNGPYVRKVEKNGPEKDS